MAGTLDDEILRVTGGPTVNDGLRAFFLGAGATGETLPDLEKSFLLLAVATATPEWCISDLWMTLLEQLGFLEGTLQDRQLQFWSIQ